MKSKYLILFASMGVAAFLLVQSRALAQSAPSLGAAATFAVLGASTVTNTGLTVVTGDLGVSPGTAVTGFPPGTVSGTIYTGPLSAAGPAQRDAALAFLALTQPCDVNFPAAVQLAGRTLGPGVYCSPTSALLNGTLNLTGDGPWIFRIGTTLTTGGSPAAPARVIVNGAPNCDGKDVFWQIGTSATIGAFTEFSGNIVAFTSITLVNGASVAGRAFALNGAVTMDTNEVAVCGGGGGCRVRVILECDDDHDDHDDHHDHGDHDDHDDHMTTTER